MLSVILPVLVLFVLVLVPIKTIKNYNVRIALLAAAGTALVMGKVPISQVLPSAISGIDRISWVIGLSLFGSIYAQTQVKLGTIDTVLNSLRASVGKTPKGLVGSILITLVIAGSLLGDAIASVTVIGILVVGALADLKLSAEKTGAIIMMGGLLGSIMPPITQGFFLAAGLIGTDVDPVIRIGYFTVAGGVIIAILTAWHFLEIKDMPEELIPDRKAGEILVSEWKLLLPLAVLVGIIILRTAFKIELLALIDPLVKPFAKIPIIRAISGFGGASRTNQAIIVAILASFCFPKVFKQSRLVLGDGLKAVNKTVQIQCCAGVMLGSFYASGMIEKIVTFTQGLSAQTLKLGGGTMLGLVGMMTGSQTTAQNTIVPFLGPILTNNLQVAPVDAALGAAHIAMAGQSLPPANLTAFVVAGIVGGVLAGKADPIKMSIYALPVTIYSFAIGFAAWFGLF